jgi:hypothetical protein
MRGMDGAFTIIDAGLPTTVEAAVDGDRVLVGIEALERATGWLRKPEGLCRDDVCVPVRSPDLDVDGRIDLAVFAAALRRPAAVDAKERAAFLGTAAAERADALTAEEVPDFRLPDLEGHEHSLSEHRGRKVLLVVYASW